MGTAKFLGPRWDHTGAARAGVVLRTSTTSYDAAGRAVTSSSSTTTAATEAAVMTSNVPAVSGWNSSAPPQSEFLSSYWDRHGLSAQAQVFGNARSAAEWGSRFAPKSTMNSQPNTPLNIPAISPALTYSTIPMTRYL